MRTINDHEPRTIHEYAIVLDDAEQELRRVRAAAHAVVEAYFSRFESAHSPGVFGPIDDEIVALKAALC